MKNLLLILLLFPIIVSAQMPPYAQQFIVYTNITQGYTVPGSRVKAIAHLVTELVGNCTAGGTTYKAEWANIVAAYPIIGNTANSNKTNLVNTATHGLTFGGSPTMDLVEGVQFNGSTQYAATDINPSLLSSAQIGIGAYSRTNITPGNVAYLGATADAGGQTYFTPRDGSNLLRYPVNTIAGPQGSNSTSTQGFYYVNKTVTVVSAYKNATDLFSTTTASVAPNMPLYIGAVYYPTISGPAAFCAYHCVFALITLNLPGDADEASIYNAIQDYQTILARQEAFPLLIFLSMLSFLFSKPVKRQDSFWFVKIPMPFVDTMVGKIHNDNSFTYGVTLTGDTVTAASAQADFPVEFHALSNSGYPIDSLLLSPDEFQQVQIK